MAGYSGTPLLKKLGIRDGHRVLLHNAPSNLPLELTTYSKTRLQNDLDVVLLFAKSSAQYRAQFGPLTKSIKSDGAIWVAWPKKASGVQTDLTEDVVRNHALQTTFVDVKVCAIDDTWSGLKLVVRKEHRPAHAARDRRQTSG
jgi:hypothetical protein